MPFFDHENHTLGGIPYLPYDPPRNNLERHKWGPEHPDFIPGTDYERPLPIKTDFPDFPDFSESEGSEGGNSSKARRKNRKPPTDPISPIDPQDRPSNDPLGGLKDYTWDRATTIDPTDGMPYNPVPSPLNPPLPKPPRNPNKPPTVCGIGKLPHWSFGGDHTEDSSVVQAQLWGWGVYPSVPTVGKKEDYGRELVYFRNGIDPHFRNSIRAGKEAIARGFKDPIVCPYPRDNTTHKTEESSGIGECGPWGVVDTFWTHKGTLLWLKSTFDVARVEYERYEPLGFAYAQYCTSSERIKSSYFHSDYMDYGASVDCIQTFLPKPRGNYHPPGRPYRRDNEMGCQWQKEEVSYRLPKLKIGSTEVGGDSIKIDDGLIPFADYMCKSIEIMFKGLGLDKISEHEMPKNILKRGPLDQKVRFQSLGEMVHWQFNNTSALIGAPVETAIKNIDGEEKTINFRSVQDVLSFLFHQQKESDSDLWVIENYLVRIAQQLEAVTQICLKQEADIDMLVKEAGFKWDWETRERPTFFKTGMKDDDEKTGVIELFKGGKVRYPARKWADELDQRQISMTTNLYAEISAKSNMFKIDSSEDLPGFAARKKMKKNNEDSWLEYLKTVNEAGGKAQDASGPEIKGVVSGFSTPRIEEYTGGTYEAKKPKEPTSGLSLFQKKPKEKKKT